MSDPVTLENMVLFCVFMNSYSGSASGPFTSTFKGEGGEGEAERAGTEKGRGSERVRRGEDLPFSIYRSRSATEERPPPATRRGRSARKNE